MPCLPRLKKICTYRTTLLKPIIHFVGKLSYTDGTWVWSQNVKNEFGSNNNGGTRILTDRGPHIQ